MADNSSGGTAGALRKIKRVSERVTVLEDQAPPPGTTDIYSAADWPDAVAGVITLTPFHVYRLRGQSVLAPNTTFEGFSVTFIGDTTPGTAILAGATAPLFKSTAPGYWQFIGALVMNAVGPVLDLDLGTGDLALFVLDGRAALSGGGAGTVGIIRSSTRLTVNNANMADFADGLQIDGVHQEVSFNGAALTSTSGASDYVAIQVLSGATVQSTMISDCRFTTVNASDRCIRFDPAATYSTSAQINTCALRGAGQFFKAGSLDQADPKVISVNSHSATPDSLWTAAAGFNGNSDVTTFPLQGTRYPFGNGTPAHTLFNGGSIVERFTLSGAETQLQKFTYDGLVPRAFKLEVECELDKGGGGSVICEICLHVDGVPVPDSVTETDVTNRATFAKAKTTVTMSPGQTFSPCISNTTSTASVTIHSAKISAERVV